MKYLIILVKISGRMYEEYHNKISQSMIVINILDLLINV